MNTRVIKDFDELTPEEMLALLNHFRYSIKDIDSYDELTNDEKKIISKEVFNSLTEQ